MKAILEKKLYIKYEKYLSEVFWGFECGDGWYNLITECLDEILDWYKQNHPEDIEGDPPEFQILQIKEKYAGIRIYIGGSYEPVFDIITKAEDKSYSICEKCGKEGETRDVRHWYKTLCDTHWEEWKSS